MTLARRVRNPTRHDIVNSSTHFRNNQSPGKLLSRPQSQTENDEKSMQATCPYCEVSFTKRRRDQKFCKAGCRSLFGQRKARAQNAVNSRNSRSKRRTNLELFERMIFYTERYRRTRTCEQLGFLSDLVSAARAGDPKLRAVLLNPYFVEANNNDARKRLSRHRMKYSIGKIVDLYCQHFWKASSYDVILGLVPEPDTGVISEDDLEPARESA